MQDLRHHDETAIQGDEISKNRAQIEEKNVTVLKAFT